MPFSNTKGEGYEDKIAELFAKELGLPVKYYYFASGSPLSQYVTL